MIAAQGPAAVEMVAELFPAADVRGLKYYFCTASTFRGVPAVVSRTGYTGEDGLEVVVPNSHGVALWDELVAKGAQPCGLGARDTLRLEAAMPLYGHELGEQIDPIQAGLSWAVKLDKGEFIGRDAIRKLGADTSRPVRVGLELDGKRAAREGCGVIGVGDEPVGTVTSGSFCPWVEKSLAMAYVAPANSAVGTPLDVDIRGTRTPATVVPLPFYKRKK
jgi:aminomethyltransferase